MLVAGSAALRVRLRVGALVAAAASAAAAAAAALDTLEELMMSGELVDGGNPAGLCPRDTSIAGRTSSSADAAFVERVRGLVVRGVVEAAAFFALGFLVGVACSRINSKPSIGMSMDSSSASNDCSSALVFFSSSRCFLVSS